MFDYIVHSNLLLFHPHSVYRTLTLDNSEKNSISLYNNIKAYFHHRVEC